MIPAGTRIADRYVLEDLLAEGGMGSVYTATDERFERRVALKIARGLGNRLQRIKARFKREAQLGNELGQASGFVRAFDWGELDDGTGLYLAMDLIAGATPLQLHTGRVQERLDRLRRAALLVAEAHGRGILHRDLKPDNFLHAPDGAIYLADFGLGKRFGDDDEGSSERDLTQSGVAMGTPAFMPPEQFDDAKNADLRADLYALGVMLFHALTGDYPYGRKLHEVAGRQQKVLTGAEAAPSLRAAADAVAAGLGAAHAQALRAAAAALDRVCARAMTLDRARRLDSAAAFAAELEAFDPSALGTDPDLARAVAEAETLDLPPAGSGPDSGPAAFASTVSEAEPFSEETTPPPGAVRPPASTRPDPPSTRRDPTSEPPTRPAWVVPAAAGVGLLLVALGVAALGPSPSPEPTGTLQAELPTPAASPTPAPSTPSAAPSAAPSPAPSRSPTRAVTPAPTPTPTGRPPPAKPTPAPTPTPTKRPPPAKPTPAPTPEVERRGSPERRARFGKAIAAAREQLREAKTRLTRRSAERLAAEAAERKRARAGSRRARNGRWRKDRVVEYDERGFKLLSGLKYSWDAAPAQLGYEVRRFGTDPKDGRALFRLALYALRRGLFDEGEAELKRAVARRADLASLAPEVARLRDEVRPFRGATTFDPKRPEAAIRCTWNFSLPRDLQDVEPLHSMMRARRARGGLSLEAPPGFLLVCAKLRGRWRGAVSLQARVKTLYPPPFIAIWTDEGAYQLDLSPQVRLRRFLAKTKATAGPRRLKAGDLVRLDLTPRKRGGIRLRLWRKNGIIFERSLRGRAKNLQLGLGGTFFGAKGARGASVWDDLLISGTPDPSWLTGLRVRGLSSIARRLRDLESTLRAEPPAAKVSLEFGAPKTSAEDAVGERGIAARTLKLVADGRALLARGEGARAAEAFRRASGHPDYAAAHYLYGRWLLKRSQYSAALDLLDRALARIEDFYEAHAARAMTLARMGRTDEARRAVDAALAIRPDYAPAYRARADLHVQAGRYDDALEDLQLAAELAPDEPYTRQALARVRALIAGPAWAGSVQESSRHYLVETDLIEDAPRLGRILETLRAHYAAQLPVLVAPKRTARQAQVLVFSDPETFYDYSERSSGTRSETSLGHFNAWSGQLLVLLRPRDLTRAGGLHVLAHEAVHQWTHTQGARLPFWANEGLAEYLAGVTLSPDGREVTPALNPFLRHRLEELTRRWAQRTVAWFDLLTQSPAEFYAGDVRLKYAQVWTMVDFIQRGGDAALKQTFTRYLRRLQRDGRAVNLEHLYVDTFHQLDMKEVQRRWEAWVAKLAAEAKLPFKR